MRLTPAGYVASKGGAVAARELVAVVGRARLRRAVRDGELVRLRRDRYCLPGTDEALALAVGAGGCLSHVSAAVHHGWGVLTRWDVTCITLRQGRHPGPDLGVRWSYAPLSDEELQAGVTGPVRTVLDCARTLPFRQALAVADSALREGAVTAEELHHAAATSRAHGVAAARVVVARADGRAANPFESALRAIVLEHGLTGFVPQLVVTGPDLFACVDLGDPTRRVALEADGYAVHGTRRAFAVDLARHDDLQSEGWVSRRFAYEHVLFRGDWVGKQAVAAVHQRLVHRR